MSHSCPTCGNRLADKPIEKSAAERLDTPEMRRIGWVGVSQLAPKRKWRKRAKQYAAMENPPRDWPENSEPWLHVRGLPIPEGGAQPF